MSSSSSLWSKLVIVITVSWLSPLEAFLVSTKHSSLWKYQKNHVCPSQPRTHPCLKSSTSDDDTGITRWFVKTETFTKPYLVVKPFLEQHRVWVADLRTNGVEVTSGYRVDSEGKPGGGGMMFFASTDYPSAEALVKKDPLIQNDCVDWRLNEWIAEVGGIQLI